MNGFETLDYVGKVIAMAASLMVLAVCFKAYQRTKIKPLLIIGVSACVALLALIADILFLKNIQNQSAFIAVWITVIILWILDVVLYAIGICQLVSQHFSPASTKEQDSQES
ncbi:MAG: hypothetical protein AAF357_19065 [Verrucomicrobiota bacterium]